MQMKTTMLAAAIAAMTLQAMSVKAEEVMTKENGTYVVNTATLGNSVTGYNGTTPLKVYIKKNKIVKIEILRNQETPKYLAKVKKQLGTKWDGMKVNDALKQEIDGVTGATFTSNAIKENIRLALEYYKSHK